MGIFFRKKPVQIGSVLVLVLSAWGLTRNLGFCQNYRKFAGPAVTAPYDGTGLSNAQSQASSMPRDPVVEVKKEDLEGKPLVDFSVLASFNFAYPDVDGDATPSEEPETSKSDYPPSILKLNGAEVAIPGFMIPMDQDEEGDKSSYFILVRNQMSCCFGVAPGLNEWVSVRMEKGHEALLEMDQPVVVVGTLDVGEVYNPDSGWTFYRMKGEKVIIAGKKKVWLQ
jgi:hypothetical protein